MIYFGCAGSSLLWWLSLPEARGYNTASCGTRAACCSAFSYCGAWAQSAQVSVVAVRGSEVAARRLVAPQHVGSSRTWDQTSIGRQADSYPLVQQVSLSTFFYFYVPHKTIHNFKTCQHTIFSLPSHGTGTSPWPRRFWSKNCP